MQNSIPASANTPQYLRRHIVAIRQTEAATANASSFFLMHALARGGSSGCHFGYDHRGIHYINAAGKATRLYLQTTPIISAIAGDGWLLLSQTNNYLVRLSVRTP